MHVIKGCNNLSRECDFLLEYNYLDQAFPRTTGESGIVWNVRPQSSSPRKVQEESDLFKLKRTTIPWN